MSREFNSNGVVGGGSFRAQFASGVLNIPSSSTGTLVTLTPPDGQRVRLTLLVNAPATEPTSLTTITIDGVVVVTALVLMRSTGSTTTGVFGVGNQSGAEPEITGDVNEAIVVSTNVATTDSIQYAYEFGE